MSIQNSNLANYGYDTVVAVTQKGINNAIETYYNDTHTFSALSLYFIKDADGTPKQVDLSGITVGSNSINVDPLSGTAKTPLTQAQINIIKSSNLWFAFNLYIGNPAGYAAAKYLIINPGSNTVNYDLLCKTLHVAFWNPDNSTWVDVLQTSKEEFNINASVNLETVISNANITQTVQNGIDYIMSTYNLSSTDLNIQQLLFDADSAVVSPTSTLTQVDPSCSVFKPLIQQFAKSYFATYLAQAPALDYAVTQNNTSTLLPTKMDIFAGAFVDSSGNPITNPTEDQQDLATLNYLFATGTDPLNGGKQFNWNWLEDNGTTSHNPDLDPTADVNKYDGAIAIRRDAFASYFHKQLTPYVLSNYYKATSIDVGNAFVGTPEYTIEIDWFPLNSTDGVQKFNPGMAGLAPDTLLSYECTSRISQEGWATNGSMTVNTFFYLTLAVDTPSYPQTTSANLILTQALWVIIDSVNSGTISNPDYNKHVISKTYVDNFSVVIDSNGDLNLVNTGSKLTDTSDPNPPTYISEAMQMFKNWGTAYAFTAVPVTMPKQFVFPGGNAFTFQDAQFSKNSDVVCHIKYMAEN